MNNFIAAFLLNYQYYLNGILEVLANFESNLNLFLMFLICL